jgi:hypothetical protein
VFACVYASSRAIVLKRRCVASRCRNLKGELVGSTKSQCVRLRHVILNKVTDWEEAVLKCLAILWSKSV